MAAPTWCPQIGMSQSCGSVMLQIQRFRTTSSPSSWMPSMAMSAFIGNNLGTPQAITRAAEGFFLKKTHI
jgi:hypothetical protein